MTSKAKVIQFVGPPCSGKTAISGILFNELKNKNLKVLYLEKRPEDFKNFYNFLDKILRQFLLVLVALVFLPFLIKNKKSSAKPSLNWIHRLGNEYKNSIICRRYVKSKIGQFDVIIADHCLESMYLFEMADPRNLAGFKLWPVINFFMKHFPKIKMDNSYFIWAEPKILADRLKYKNKIVRKDLSGQEIDIFFSNSLRLMEFLKNKLPLPYFSDSFEFIDSSFNTPKQIADNILSNISLNCQ